MKCLIINHHSRFINSLKNLFSGMSMVDVVDYINFNPKLAEQYDFIVLSGGPIHISNIEDLVKEKEFIRTTNKPILGICLGLQIFGIVFGSKLNQMGSLREGYFDFELFGKKGKIYYNHKECIKDLPQEFILLKESEGMIEAMMHENKPFLALQGHLELSGKYGTEIRDIFIDKFVKKRLFFKNEHNSG